MDKETLIDIWQEWVDRQTQDKFILNPNKEHVIKVADGVLILEKKKELKYCPCRLTTGDFEKDIELICPCNFKIQKTWKEKGECWCGLFVKPV